MKKVLFFGFESPIHGTSKGFESQIRIIRGEKWFESQIQIQNCWIGIQIWMQKDSSPQYQNLKFQEKMKKETINKNISEVHTAFEFAKSA